VEQTLRDPTIVKNRTEETLANYVELQRVQDWSAPESFCEKLRYQEEDVGRKRWFLGDDFFGWHHGVASFPCIHAHGDAVFHDFWNAAAETERDRT